MKIFTLYIGFLLSIISLYAGKNTQISLDFANGSLVCPKKVRLNFDDSCQLLPENHSLPIYHKHITISSRCALQHSLTIKKQFADAPDQMSVDLSSYSKRLFSNTILPLLHLMQAEKKAESSIAEVLEQKIQKKIAALSIKKMIDTTIATSKLFLDIPKVNTILLDNLSTIITGDNGIELLNDAGFCSKVLSLDDISKNELSNRIKIKLEKIEHRGNYVRFYGKYRQLANLPQNIFFIEYVQSLKLSDMLLFILIENFFKHKGIKNFTRRDAGFTNNKFNVPVHFRSTYKNWDDDLKNHQAIRFVTDQSQCTIL